METDLRLRGRSENACRGWTDVNLLASARLTACQLLTLDRRLRDVSFGLGLGYVA